MFLAYSIQYHKFEVGGSLVKRQHKKIESEVIRRDLKDRKISNEPAKDRPTRK